MVPSSRTDRLTVYGPDQTDPPPLKKQSDQDLHSLPFCLHLLDTLFQFLENYSKFVVVSEFFFLIFFYSNTLEILTAGLSGHLQAVENIPLYPLFVFIA